MVISFSKKEPRQRLLNGMEVITFRPSLRAKTQRGVQQTWANSGRGTTKIADVTVQHLTEHQHGTRQFEQYQAYSGFDTPDEWKAVVREMHDEIPSDGHFYTVSTGLDSFLNER
jgi:hypothetical protein